MQVVRLNDVGSHGGAMISASSSLTENNLGVCRVGDTYACSKHGNNPITTGTSNFINEGKQVALNGCSTQCGATITASGSNLNVGS